MAAAVDALIVGAGLSGLAAGIRLAHFGRRVLVCERHTRAGGLNSWYRRDGREVSVGLHAVTHAPPPGREAAAGGALARLLRQLRIKPSAWALAPQRGSAIRFPSATLHFDNDPETLAGEVARAFPREADGFARLRRAVLAVDEAADAPGPAVPSGARARVAAYVRDPLLADMLCAPPMFYGASLPGDMDWTSFCVLWKGLFETGLAIPAGGMRAVVDSLVDRLRAAGGVLRLGVGVARLLGDGRDGPVRAARLDDGEEIEADLFFSSAGLPATEALAAPMAAECPAPSASGGPPDGAPWPVTIVEALFAWPGDPAADGLPDATTFFSFADRFDHGPDAGGPANFANGVAAVPNNFARPVPPTEASLRLSALADFRRWHEILGGLDARAAPPARRAAYAEAKARVAEALLANARRLGLTPAAAPRTVDVFTPLTIARYAGHAGGALYGGAAKRRDARTARPNLFLLGADQGFHGIVGAMLSGVAVANRYGLDRRAPPPVS